MGWERRKRGPSLATLLCASVALLRLGGTSGGDPLPILEPVDSTPVDRLISAKLERTASATAACSASVDCDDGQACTSDICSNGTCLNVPIANCVPCTPGYLCPPIDVVFMMDTSGSMRDEAAALCAGIAQVIADLNQQGVVIRANFLGITQTPGDSFSCLTDHVLRLLGGTVPGDAESCPFPGGTSAYESWGPATAIVAERFPWTTGATRLVVPISDEGPCDGSRPEGCNDLGDDRDSITNAIAVALANNVVISPICGTGSDDCVINLATAAALDTAGLVMLSKNPKLDLTDAIRRIIVDGCGVDTRCDDQQACTTGDRCTNGVCIGTPIEGCRPCTTAADCNDQNPCTTDSCVAGVCSSTLSYDVSVECCDPRSGSLAPVDDGFPCTRDVCDPVTGQVDHSPGPAGVPCNDGQVCTLVDTCDGSGECVGLDAGSVNCTTDADCFGVVCAQELGRCRCDTTPELRLMAILEADCHPFGDELVVDVELGSSTEIISGGQFVIEYDPAVLDFLMIQPGTVVDPASPFGVQLASDANESTGQIFYAVTVSLGHPGTQDSAIMARLRFRPIKKCRGTDICFIDAPPRLTRLVSPLGISVPHTRYCMGDLYITGAGPVLTCPDSVALNAEAGRISANATWDPIRATSECDGTLQVQCHGLNEAAVPFESLIPTGGRFPIGHFEFECTATDSCGASSSCLWNVDVGDSNTVEVDLQLSAVMTSNLLRRCIEFEFYRNCSEEPVVIEQTVEFGGLFNFPGAARNVILKIPPGSYGCVTARDPRHTLRSVAHPVNIDGKYLIAFIGDPTFGGNWLVNGNLNGDRVIDLLDHTLLLAQYSATLDRNTPCETGSALHADLNGNGVVDTNDLTFIQRNFLATDEGACCANTAGGAATSEPSVVFLEELDALGLPDLRDADVNHDGLLDAEEIMSFLQSGPPAVGTAP